MCLQAAWFGFTSPRRSAWDGRGIVRMGYWDARLLETKGGSRVKSEIHGGGKEKEERGRYVTSG